MKSTKQCKFLLDYVISTKQSEWRNLRGSAIVNDLYTIMSLREATVFVEPWQSPERELCENGAEHRSYVHY